MYKLQTQKRGKVNLENPRKGSGREDLIGALEESIVLFLAP
jgi:hypothetical protein